MHDVSGGHTHGHSHGHSHSHDAVSADGQAVPRGQRIAPTALAKDPEASTHLWIDATEGAAGDMLLGALIDAGADEGSIAAAVEAVAGGLVHLQKRTVMRGPFRAVKVDVIADEPNPPARHLSDIRRMLDEAGLPERTRRLATQAFELIAHAEAHAHGVDIDDIHFHEVGALDSIADIVGVAEAVRTLGVEDATSSVVAVGAGHVHTMHGTLTVPPPAVVALAEGWRVAAGGPDDVGELCTPTGMALIRTLASSQGNMPDMTVLATGSGAGTRIRHDRAGLCRAVLGKPHRNHGQAPSQKKTPPSTVMLIEANVDDMDPRLWPGVIDRLLEAGAVDAWLAPVIMKKGRPAHIVSALAAADAVDSVVDTLLSHTSTIGVRINAPAHRRVLHRDIAHLDIDGADVRIKVSGDAATGTIRHASVEYDDIAGAAKKLQRSEKDVLHQAQASMWDAGIRPGQPMLQSPRRSHE